MTVDWGQHGNHAISGGFAGGIAQILLFPMETISLRFKVGGSQVLKTLLLNESPLALWSGSVAGVCGTIPSTALYFVAYEKLKQLGEASFPQHLPLVHLGAGATGEFVSSIIYVPFEVTKARMQLGKNPNRASAGNIPQLTNYPNSLQAIQDIYKREGRRGLYAGYLPCILTDTCFRGITFMLYEWFKLQHPTTSWVGDLGLGFAAGATSAFLTNPLDVLTVRSMTLGMGKGGLKKESTIRVAIEQMKQCGPSVLFHGVWYRVGALAPHSAMTFAIFESTLKFLKLEE
jgi:hypothetical protein